MGRKAFWTTYHGQKWTTAVFSAGPAIVSADSLSPVSSTLCQQASSLNNRQKIYRKVGEKFSKYRVSQKARNFEVLMVEVEYEQKGFPEIIAMEHDVYRD